MNIVNAIILGIIEGATEFLPVSSTFHMLVVSRLLGIANDDFLKLFSIFIQSGAILAVAILFFKDLWKDKSLVLKAGVSFVPTAVVGLTFYDTIKNVFFESPFLSTVVFIIVGIVFIIVEKLIQKESLQLTKVEHDITYWQALIIGAAQALAVFPGVSRAGSVMIAMMLLRYKRTDAARYSFILSIPTIFAASLLDFIEMRELALSSTTTISLLIIGTITAFITAIIVVKWFIGYLQTHSLAAFGWYRITAGALLLLFGK